MISKVFAGIIGVGAASSIAAVVIAPSAYPATMAAVGGALGGASVVNEIRRKQEKQEIEAAEVGSAFTALYENNKGLVCPQQLSFLCSIPLETTNKFLSHLADAQGGKVVKTERGDMFDFPHPANVLEQLSANAQAWVKSQNEPVLQENANLKAELMQLKAVLSMQPRPQPQQQLKNNEEPQDPWNKLL